MRRFVGWGMAACRPRQRILPAVLALFLLAGCAVRLVPAYDAAIVEELAAANRQTLQLFAEVSEGVPSDTYEERKATYNAIIGAFEALRVQASARPVPRPLIAQWLGIGGAEGKEPSEIEKLQNPTPGILATVVETVTRMRSVDKDPERALSETLVEGFKQSYEISIEQALTFEKALER